MPLLISTKDIGLSPELRNKLTALGISASTFDELLNLVVEEATKVQTQEPITASTLPAEARSFGLGGGSSQAAKLTERTFKWDSNDTKLTYDISNIRQNLPDGISYISTNVVLTGKGRAASRSAAGSLTLPENPTQATVNISLNTTYGGLILKKSFPISPNSTGSVVLDVDDQSASPTNMTVAENLELLNGVAATLLSQK